MLFDLKGKRRRVVQATYLMLAVLMGGGLVLFGIGGDVSGGLFDAFSERGGVSGGNSLVTDRVERAGERLKRNPRDEAALKDLARAEFQLATEDASEATGEFTTEGKVHLRRASGAWKRYVALPPPEPDDSLAGLMIQVYGPLGLNQAPEAARAAEIVAEARESSPAFIQLVQYATLAGQSRKADLAGRRAIELAPRDERALVKAQVEQAKSTSPGGAPGGEQGQGSAPAPP